LFRRALEHRPIAVKVCFCDIPFGDLNIHIQKYSEFGFAFRKSFLVERGASPVFYLAKNATVPGSYSDAQLGPHFLEMIGRLHDLVDSADTREAIDLNVFLSHQLLGYLKPFGSRNADDNSDNYYMEREWRIIGGVRFAIEDVCRIIIPRSHAQPLRERSTSVSMKRNSQLVKNTRSAIACYHLAGGSFSPPPRRTECSRSANRPEGREHQMEGQRRRKENSA